MYLLIDSVSALFYIYLNELLFDNNIQANELVQKELKKNPIGGGENEDNDILDLLQAA